MHIYFLIVYAFFLAKSQPYWWWSRETANCYKLSFRMRKQRSPWPSELQTLLLPKWTLILMVLWSPETFFLLESWSSGSLSVDQPSRDSLASKVASLSYSEYNWNSRLRIWCSVSLMQVWPVDAVPFHIGSLWRFLCFFFLRWALAFCEIF